MVIPHYMGRSSDVEIERKNVEDNNKILQRQDSFTSRSSLQDIPLLLPQEPGSVDTPPSGSPTSNSLNSNGHMTDHQSRIIHNQPFSFRKPKAGAVVADMPMKGFVDDLEMELHVKVSSTGGKALDSEWWETQERGDQMVSADETGQVGPRTSCQCQVGYFCGLIITAWY